MIAAGTSLVTLYAAHNWLPSLNNAYSYPQGKTSSTNYASYTSAAPAIPGGAIDFEPAAESSVPAVVHVRTATAGKVVVANDPLSEFFGNPQQYYYRQGPQMGSGSGVIISPDGYITTNNHVIAGADEVVVTLSNKKTLKAKVVGSDPSTDIAVLKVEGKDLPYLAFGNSDDVRLGQWVLAVGYPLNLETTVTAGIVSAKYRNIGINKRQSQNAIESFIQTDAAVNPGNSGGALVNTQGQLVGINSAIASPTGSYAGYSYAIPSNIVRKVVDDLRKYGTVQRAYLGIGFQELNPDVNEKLNLPRDLKGVYVNSINAKSGAEQAGLQKGDIITKLNGRAVSSEPELREQVASYRPGDHLNVTYLRNSKEYQASVELKNMDGTTAFIEKSDNVELGAKFRNISNDEARKIGVPGGVQVSDLGQGLLSKQTNMKKGFVITQVNGETVKNIDELNNALSGSANGNVQLSGVYPGYDGVYYFGIAMNE